MNGAIQLNISQTSTSVSTKQDPFCHKVFGARFSCKIWTILSGKKSCTESCSKPPQNSRFFFLVSSKIPCKIPCKIFCKIPSRLPHPYSYHGRQGRPGRRGYRREYLYGRGVQWLELKPRACCIGRCTRIIFIFGLSPSNSPEATVHMRRGGRRLC